eukprot:TRINITY_DN61306_c0_g1_i1.p1 TRINITY_DN61306_c0_g1~~TRINITY_DN61306_c0_g1_i1.p1  ORF type:complete len:382 (-),score=49.44 TRINITY_DN61306_c0_g1_i1:146-1291(-)
MPRTVAFKQPESCCRRQPLESKSEQPLEFFRVRNGGWCGTSMGLCSRHFVVCLAIGVTLHAPTILAVTVFEVGKQQGHVEIRHDVPGPREFFDEYIKGGSGPFRGVGRPALFKGAARRMPAMGWTDDYLREKHGKTTLDQVETEKRETRTKMPHDTWTISKFLDNYMTKEIYSTAITPKGLSDEVYLLPSMNCGGYHKQLSATVFWMSSGSTQSVIHSDQQQNIHCMFAGQKNWALWRPDTNIASREMGWIDGEEEAKSNPEFENAYGHYGGKIKVEDVDLKAYPGWAELQAWNMTLSQGDCAFVPKGWFHYVEAPPMRAISVHVWFKTGKKFDSAGCEKLEQSGRNTSDFVFRISDCTWSEDGEKTKCKPKSKALPKMEL